VTDPFDEKVGKYPRGVSANIVTISHEHPDHNAAGLVEGNPFMVTGPGEYEVGGVSVIGVATWHDEQNGQERGMNTVYVIEMDGLRVAHLGDLGHGFSQQQLEELGSIDVALVPVGGYYTIDAKKAAEVVKQLDPWVVIPMHYKQEGVNVANLVGVEEFLKEMGKPETVPVPKFVISTDKLPEELQVVVLEKK
jgi:L-ascorbate metabolism protein UlaG (beta-lactamase superfamily)